MTPCGSVRGPGSAAESPLEKNRRLKGPKGHFLDKMRRSAHRRKCLNKTDLTKTKRDTTNYYKKCGAAAKAAAPSTGMRTSNGAAQDEGDRARRARRAQVLAA